MNKVFWITIVLVSFVTVALTYFSNKANDIYNTKLFICDENMNSYIMDFKSNKLSEYDTEKYLQKSSKSFIFVTQKDGNSVISIIDKYNNKSDVFIEHYVWGTPVLINDALFFIATKTEDRYKEAYLYSYVNGVVKKVSERQVDSISDIICDDKNLYFTEKISLEKYFIVQHSVLTDKETVIIEGRFPCWKECGSSLFCSTGSWWKNLSLFELSSLSETVVAKDVGIVGTPEYNNKDNLLLYWWDDDRASGAGFIRKVALLDLNKMKKINLNGHKILQDPSYCKWVN